MYMIANLHSRLYKIKRKLLFPKPDKKFQYWFIYGWRKKFPFTIFGTCVLFNTRGSHTKQFFYPNRYEKATEYESYVSRIIFDSRNQNSCYLDVGANIGYFSICFAKLFPQAQVHAFDVDADVLRELRSSLILNNLSNVHTICAAVWERSGKIFSFSRRGRGSDTNFLKPEVVNSYSLVPSITIDDYVGELRIEPDIIKIDVEGAEIEVLMGMKRTLNTVRSMLVELHIEFWDDPKQRLADLISLLGKYPFTYSIIMPEQNYSPQPISLSELTHLTKRCFLLVENTTKMIG